MVILSFFIMIIIFTYSQSQYIRTKSSHLHFVTYEKEKINNSLPEKYFLVSGLLESDVSPI